MAAGGPVRGLELEVTCSICLQYFEDPVLTDCGHNFCRPCITLHWEDGGGAQTLCPDCRELCAPQSLRPNQRLRSIVELVRELRLQPLRVRGLCEEHDEPLKLFCRGEEGLICTICSMGAPHRAHEVLPLGEAYEEYMADLQEWLQLMRTEVQDLQEPKQKEEATFRSLRGELETERLRIVAEFVRLHQHLHNAEKSLLDKLKELDEKLMQEENTKITKLTNQMSSLNDLIADLEMKCRLPAEELLKDVKNTVARCGNVSRLLPERLGKKYKVPVTLDPETAHRHLTISENERRVKWTLSKQTLLESPKRFTLARCVLGKEGFTSGRYYWEVELLQTGLDWSVGVAAECVSRTDDVTQTSQRGVWAAARRVSDDHSRQAPCLPTHQRPLKLGVYLDYEGGRVSIYNADTWEQLNTFSDTFIGGLHPYFWVGGDLRLV
ncbi:E3 ubiquitin-protein ligase TRIM39-like [Lissotriton helveticus]